MHTLLVVILLCAVPALAAEQAGRTQLPEFTSDDPGDWFNSPPLHVSRLQGKVLLVDVWTFGCWNCYRSFPWLKALEEKLAAKPFQVIGIHSPEFEHEKDRAKLAEKIEAFGLTHPVMMDQNFAYWRALNNRYWPAFYLVDKAGRIRFRHIGETHSGDARAVAMERQIRDLLAE